MTGITKDELMQMARDAGARPMAEGSVTMCLSTWELSRLVNAAIDRAAAECEKQIEREKYGHAAHAVLMAKEQVVALKINTGD